MPVQSPAIIEVEGRGGLGADTAAGAAGMTGVEVVAT